jgi:hypothetical protein
MPVKTIKFLGREKIAAKDIHLTVHRTTEPHVVKVKVDFSSHQLPPASRVFLDLKQMDTVRFNLGTVSSHTQEMSFDITKIPEGSTTYEIVVVDELSARKIADGLARLQTSPTDPQSGSASPLLPVDGSIGLDGIIWRIDYDAPGQEGAIDAPVLRIDKEACNDSPTGFLAKPELSTLILPAAMAIILNKILLADEHAYDATSARWQNGWVRFASGISKKAPPNIKDAEEVSQWIEDSCAKFASNKDMLAEFIKSQNI